MSIDHLKVSWFIEPFHLRFQFNVEIPGRITLKWAMPLDYQTLDALRQNHPAWRLLNSPHAPLIASFFHKVFVDKNARILPQAALVEALQDELFTLRELRSRRIGVPRHSGDIQNSASPALPRKSWASRLPTAPNCPIIFRLHNRAACKNTLEPQQQLFSKSATVTA